MSDIYKRAVLTRLRFTSKTGVFSGEYDVEQVAQLGKNALQLLAAEYDDARVKATKKSYIEDDEPQVENTNSKEELRFQLVVDILNTKVKQGKAAAKARETRERNQRIMEMIATKELEAESAKSVEDLRALLVPEDSLEDF